MNNDNVRILVIGAGVNGSICAAKLSNAGIDVTIIARGNRFEEIQNAGIIIEDPFKNTRSLTKVPVINGLKSDDIYDYILIVIRKNQVSNLLPALACNPSPNIVFMVNNILGSGDFTNVLGQERVMSGFIFGGGKRDGSVIRAISGFVMSTPFGEIDGRVTPRLNRLIVIFHQAGLKAKISTHISDYLATHAALVAPLANILKKHGCDTYALAHSPTDLRLMVDAMRETLDVLDATGAVDSTGFRTDQSSAYYSFRSGKPKRDWIKGSYVITTNQQLIIGTHASYGRYQDSVLLDRLRNQVGSYAMKDWLLVADAGFDGRQT